MAGVDAKLVVSAVAEGGAYDASGILLRLSVQ